MTKYPSAKHALIAHSHGGSVALLAARYLSEEHCNRLTILGMASPFAQPVTVQTYPIQITELYNHFRLAVIAPLVALGILALWMSANAIFDLSSIPVVRAIASSPNLFLFSIFAVTLDSFRTRDFETFRKEIERRLPVELFIPRRFLVPGDGLTPAVRLFALRGSGDEASLVINTTQFIHFLAGLLCVQIPYFLIGKVSKFLSTRRKLGLLALGTSACFLFLLYIDYKATGDPLGSIRENPLLVFPLALLMSASIAWPYIYLFERFFRASFSIAASMILVPAQALLALAVGSEVITSFGLVGVECEPVPADVTATVQTIRSPAAGMISGLGMVHSIHRVPEARAAIAKILRDITGAPLESARAD
jgi:hypothetical protein